MMLANAENRQIALTFSFNIATNITTWLGCNIYNQETLAFLTDIDTLFTEIEYLCIVDII